VNEIDITPSFILVETQQPLWRNEVSCEQSSEKYVYSDFRKMNNRYKKH